MFDPNNGTQVPEDNECGIDRSQKRPERARRSASAAVRKNKIKINGRSLIILLLVGALIIGAGVAVIVDIVGDGKFNLFGLFRSNDEDKNNTQNNNTEPVEEQKKGIDFYGMSLVLPEGYSKNERDGYSSDDVDLYGEAMSIKDIAKAWGAQKSTFLTAESVAKNYCDMIGLKNATINTHGDCAYQVSEGKYEGYYYCQIAAFYADGETVWILSLYSTTEDAEIQKQMIDIVQNSYLP